MQTKSTTFGKRGAAAPVRPPLRNMPLAPAYAAPPPPAPEPAKPAVDLHPAGVPKDVVRAILQGEPGQTFVDSYHKDRYEVPTKPLAWVLASLAVGAVTGALAMMEAKTGKLALGPLTIEMGPGEDAMALSMVVALLHGLETTTKMIMLVHSLLRRLLRRTMLEYMIGGAAVSAAIAGIQLWLGTIPPSSPYSAFAHRLGNHGPEHGWMTEIITGAAAGFFYRAIAGVRIK